MAHVVAAKCRHNRHAIIAIRWHPAPRSNSENVCRCWAEYRG